MIHILCPVFGNRKSDENHGDRLWQKERLLNSYLENLPKEYDKIAWIDSDIKFENPNWLQETSDLLDSYPLVQLFSEAIVWDEPVPSFAKIKYHKKNQLKLMKPEKMGHPGFAWAARRGLLEKHGFYDAAIIGGGDTYIAFAACGKYEHLPMNMYQKKHYLEWATGFYEDVKGNIEAVSGTIKHIDHGTKENRKYFERNKKLAQLGFNPYEDIKIDRDMWKWSNEKPELHKYVEEYFAQRND